MPMFTPAPAPAPAPQPAPQPEPPAECARADCTGPAEVALGLEVYPPASVMEFYETTAPLTRMVMDLRVCRRCASALTFKDLLTPEQFLPLCKFVEESSGTTIDVDATRVVPVEFTDPEYVMMRRQSDDPQATEAPA